MSGFAWGYFDTLDTEYRDDFTVNTGWSPDFVYLMNRTGSSLKRVISTRRLDDIYDVSEFEGNASASKVYGPTTDANSPTVKSYQAQAAGTIGGFVYDNPSGSGDVGEVVWFAWSSALGGQL